MSWSPPDPELGLVSGPISVGGAGGRRERPMAWSARLIGELTCRRSRSGRRCRWPARRGWRCGPSAPRAALPPVTARERRGGRSGRRPAIRSPPPSRWRHGSPPRTAARVGRPRHAPPAAAPPAGPTGRPPRAVPSAARGTPRRAGRRPRCLSTRHVFTATPSTVCTTAERTEMACADRSPAVSLNSPRRSRAAMTSCMPPALDSYRTRGLPSSRTDRARPRSTSSVAIASRSSPISWLSARSASALISCARQGDQAAGPAARESASVRSAQQVEGFQPAVDRVDQGSQRGRIGVVSTGRQLGQGQMMADQPLDQSDVRLVQAHRLRHPSGDGGADLGVVHAGAGHLADVVQQAGQQQEVGSLDLGQVLSHLGGALHRMPVDRVPVDRIVLRLGADPAPVRDPPHDAAGEVE